MVLDVNAKVNCLFGLMRNQRGRCLAGKPTQNCRSQKAVSGQIASCRRTRNTNRGATGGKKVRKQGSIPAFDATRRVDHEPTLGMKERTGDLNREKRRRQFLF